MLMEKGNTCSLGQRCTDAASFMFGQSRKPRTKNLWPKSVADIVLALTILAMAVTAGTPSRVTMPNRYTAMKVE